MQHFKRLDGLRFIAIFLVLIEHFAISIGNKFNAAHYGVDLFFVISGFLITRILLRSNGSNLHVYSKFIGRRTLRIFPLYYGFLLTLLIIGDRFMQENILFFATYSYNYAEDYNLVNATYFQHFWSLCVEEQFYLIYPLILLTLRKNLIVFRVVLLVLITICMAQLTFNIIDLPGYQRGLFPRASSILVGCLGATFNFSDKQSVILNKRWIEFLSLILLAIVLTITPVLKFIVCPIISLYLIVKATNWEFSIKSINVFLENKNVIKIGMISYGIYVFHLPIDYYITKYVFNPFLWERINWNNLGVVGKLQWHPWIIKLPLYTIITILLASLSYTYFEKPILQLKDKWFSNS
ncbi:MAG: acyltransferase [Ferruginibacter sp.]